MNTTNEKLADALRNVQGILTGKDNPEVARRMCLNMIARTLAEYDAQPVTPTGPPTAEPWQVNAEGFTIIKPRSRPNYCDEDIMEIPQGLDDADNVAHLANARRIVACVNACAGIPTRNLESLNLEGAWLNYDWSANA